MEKKQASKGSRKPPKDGRTEFIAVRVSTEEKAALLAAAAADDRGLSVWARRVLMGAVSEVSEVPAVAAKQAPLRVVEHPVVDDEYDDEEPVAVKKPAARPVEKRPIPSRVMVNLNDVLVDCVGREDGGAVDVDASKELSQEIKRQGLNTNDVWGQLGQYTAKWDDGVIVVKADRK